MSQPRENNNELLKFLAYYFSKLSFKKNLEFEIRFGTKSKKRFLKDDIDNIIKKLLSEGFEIKKNNEHKLNIASEFIDTSGEVKQTSNIRTEIIGIHNIRKYCKTNVLSDNITHNFLQKKKEKIPEMYNPYDIKKFNMRYSLQEEIPMSDDMGIIQTLKSTWTDHKKYFRLINRMELEHPDLPFRVDISTVKSSRRSYEGYEYTYSIEESKIFNRKEHYEVEIELLNEVAINDFKKYTSEKDKKNLIKNYERLLKRGIRIILSGIQQTNFPIDEIEKKNIITDYLKLVGHKEKENEELIAYTNDFIGPSSVTLQKINLIDDPNQTIPNVLNNYTVTEKADGIRKMLYISKNGKIYFITMNMNVQFTGAKSKNSNLYDSLFDGEHVLYSKTGQFLNYYLCFDAYFIQKQDIRKEMFIENTIDETKTYRLNIAMKSFVNLRLDFVSPSYTYNLKMDVKDFFLTNPEQNINIFNICENMLKRQREGYYAYETDGLIFTPQLLGVGVNTEGEQPKIYKSTWSHSFKWKPPEYNTIDFLVEIVKDGISDVVKIKQNNGINLGKNDDVSYKILNLKVGYNSKKHGFYDNPQLDIIEGHDNKQKTDFYGEKNRKNYRPGLFYPTNPYDNNAHISYVEMKETTSGEKEILTEEGEVIETNSIVEFKYVKDNDKYWKWVPLRVRYDKTNELRTTKQNFGNAYNVANNNWQSIHNPITLEILSTGKNLFIDSSDDDVYYNKNKSLKKLTQTMCDFHNLYVKRILIHKFSNKETRLMDFAVGKGGDWPKWIHSNINFVFGVDLSRDNIENKLDGVCARYFKYKKRYKKMPNVMFLHADSSKDLLQGDAYFDERSVLIQKALLGIGTKDKKIIGKGVYDLYGIASKMFDITSIQFALHYMFKDTLTLHTFLKNVSNFTKVGGHFIGTCYDGKRMFEYLSNVKVGESKNIMKNDRKINSIIKQYDNIDFLDDASSLGYTIDVYQETINQYIREYLVNFDYFNELMEAYGFKVANNPFIKSKKAIGGFEELFNLLIQSKKQNAEYEHIKDMSEEEKIISFMNNYFIFIKTSEVDVESIFNVYVQKYGDKKLEPGEVSNNEEEE